MKVPATVHGYSNSFSCMMELPNAMKANIPLLRNGTSLFLEYLLVTERDLVFRRVIRRSALSSSRGLGKDLDQSLTFQGLRLGYKGLG